MLSDYPDISGPLMDFVFISISTAAPIKVEHDSTPASHPIFFGKGSPAATGSIRMRSGCDYALPRSSG
jgi:hypothetical protein